MRAARSFVPDRVSMGAPPRVWQTDYAASRVCCRRTERPSLSADSHMHLLTQECQGLASRLRSGWDERNAVGSCVQRDFHMCNDLLNHSITRSQLGQSISTMSFIAR